MTKDERKRVIDIYGPDYEQKDIPTYIRKRDEKRKSECCGARMIGGIQCEACGSNGKIEVEERMAEELEDERFDYHPRPEEVN